MFSRRLWLVGIVALLNGCGQLGLQVHVSQEIRALEPEFYRILRSMTSF